MLKYNYKCLHDILNNNANNSTSSFPLAITSSFQEKVKIDGINPECNFSVSVVYGLNTCT